jgi:indole-3-acetate monooxygenase
MSLSTLALADDLDGHPLVQVVHGLRPTMMAFRAEAEAAASPHPQVFETLGMANMFRLLAPRSLGGEEAPLPVLAVMLEELACTDPTVAWCVWNAFGGAYASARVEPEVARQLYADPKCYVGFSAIPGGSMRPVEGGVVVSGRWPVVSGCQLAGWFCLACVDQEASGSRAPTTVLLPASDVTIHDTWNVGTMRGTGSHAVSVSEAFVPGRFVVRGNAPPREPGAHYRIAMYTLFGPGCSAIGLGIARSALDGLTSLARRVSATNGQALGLRPGLQEGLAISTAQLRAARLGYHRAVEELWADAQDGPPGDESIAGLWMATHSTARSCHEVVETCSRVGLSDAFHLDNPIEAAFRNFRAVDSFAQRFQPFALAAGRHLLGLDPQIALW